MADPIVVTPEQGPAQAPNNPTPMGPQQLGPQNLPPTGAPGSFAGNSPATGGGVGSPGFNPAATTAGQSRPGVGVGIGSDVNPMQRSALKAQAADVQRHSLIGKAASVLLGHQVDYQVDDKGNVHQVEIKEKPGQLFRSILAGAILGGAMAANRQRGQQAGFGASFARGAGGVQQEQAQADQNRYNRAVQQFQMKQQAQTAQTENDLRKVQIAMHNSQIATQNFLLNKGVFDQTIQSAIDGKAMYEPFLKAGIKAQFEEVPASKMLDLWKTNPQAKDLLWLPTGFRMAVNDKGERYPELTYTAVDPKGTVTLTDGAIKKFNDVSLGDYFAGAKDLKAGREMDATHYMALMQAYNDRYNQQMTEIRDKLQNKRYDAETKKYLAEQAKDWAEVGKQKLDQKELTKFQEAQKHLAEVGYDPSKLDQKYPGDSAVLADYAGKLLKDETAALNAARADNPDSPETKDLMQKVQTLSGWVNYVFQAPMASKPNNPASVKSVVDQVTSDPETGEKTNVPPQDAFRKIDQSNLSPTDKIEAFKQAGAEVPWAEIVRVAAQKGMQPYQLANWFKSQGVKVEEGPKQKSADQSRATQKAESDQLNAFVP